MSVTRDWARAKGLGRAKLFYYTVVSLHPFRCSKTTPERVRAVVEEDPVVRRRCWRPGAAKRQQRGPATGDRRAHAASQVSNHRRGRGEPLGETSTGLRDRSEHACILTAFALLPASNLEPSRCDRGGPSPECQGIKNIVLSCSVWVQWTESWFSPSLSPSSSRVSTRVSHGCACLGVG